MRGLAALLLVLILTGCAVAEPRPAMQTEPPAEEPVVPPSPPPAVGGPVPLPGEPARPSPSLAAYPFQSRAALRERLAERLNQSDRPALETVKELVQRQRREGVLPWLEADLNGDGRQEVVLALPVASDEFPDRGYAAGALVVIYQQGERYAVDVSESMGRTDELHLMGAHLHGAADLAGAGRPQIIWSRPHVIATGPQPHSVFVSTWEPGRIQHLPGLMVISNLTLRLDGQELVLKGLSREEWFLRSDPRREDRYRYVDGRFRLVDRRFVTQTEFGYDRFWDGLVAEQVGRLTDAEQEYRWAADPNRPSHIGRVDRYKAMPRELSAEEMERFHPALRAFARFRLGGLLLKQGRREEAEQVLAPSGGPYDGLTEALRTAPFGEEGCRAAAAWAAGQPEFLAALNLGVGHSPWTPELLCGQMPLEDAPYLRMFILQVVVSGKEGGAAIAGARAEMPELGEVRETKLDGTADPFVITLPDRERFPYTLRVSKPGYKSCLVTYDSLLFPRFDRWWEGGRREPFRLFVYLPAGEGEAGGDDCYGGRTSPQTPGN